MNRQLRQKYLQFWTQWIKKRNQEGNPQILTAKNIYILPSKFGWAYAFLLLSLFSSAINYQISSLFLMTFLLAIIGLISAWEAHTNLRDLSIKLINIEDTVEGTPAQMVLLIQAKSKIRFAVEWSVANQQATRLEKIPDSGLEFILPISTSECGCFPLPCINISSVYPFGIFQVWGYAWFNQFYYVYPQPISPDFWPQPLAKENNNTVFKAGEDELYELKSVTNPWTEPKRIAWKIAAKGQGWYLKTMSNHEGDYWLFRLNDLPLTEKTKALRHLSYWLHTAESRGYYYRLELGKSVSQFANGKEHLKQSLRQLALY